MEWNLCSTSYPCLKYKNKRNDLLFYVILFLVLAVLRHIVIKDWFYIVFSQLV